MNLKEAFRYQNFLERMLRESFVLISSRYNAMEITKTHLRKAANPDAEDIVEKIVNENYIDPDSVIEFASILVEQKEILTKAISKAKATCDIDIDACVEANKQRQQLCAAIKTLISNKASKTVEQGKDYKFNVEGNQSMYVYNVEVEKTESFDRKSDTKKLFDMIRKSDEVSSEIDLAIINTQVDYVPLYDVNYTFDNAMTEFLENK